MRDADAGVRENESSSRCWALSGSISCPNRLGPNVGSILSGYLDVSQRL